MNSSNSGNSKSVWMTTQKTPKFSKLTQDLSVDICVVGSGIAGLTSAYLLMKEGKKVCVLESLELASGQSARTTAHFVTALDDRYFEIEKYHGEKGARLAAESHRAAIARVEKIVRDENIECEMQHTNGYLFAQNDPDTDVLKKELDACLRAGLNDVQLVDRSPIESFNTGPCLKFSNQMQLHPMKYLLALAEIIVKGGGLIFTNTHVKEVHGGEEAFVRTEDGKRILCDSVVVATNTPVNDLFAIHTKQAPYRTYVLGMKVPKGSVPHGLYWDTLDPYHYIRLEKGEEAAEEILIVGGEDHKTGQDDHPEIRFLNLESWTRERFPMATDVVYRWSGQVMEPVDGMAYLGHNPMDKNNVFIITGDSGNGMTHCTIGAMLIADQIMERENPWEDLYKPNRISLKATPEFLKENGNVAAQYADWFKAMPMPHFNDLAPGEGTVFRDGLRMIAAYKTEDGKMEYMSATCTHLAGVVHWNGVEKSWDCPCHGSRFDAHGNVIEGPAISDLKKLDTSHEEVLNEKVISRKQKSNVEQNIQKDKPTNFH
ncbi:FAD-dependent oxidoreductase [Bdellovibrio reynosensis]|uniref:FAD-dependent oxidoreductase n=1 Tax=Bdellovibrio reynosensis TaxID=2835041 RepID=A0ABY4C5I2_9BACT|nr:FAD-dependent oxidoreductase [Bdellovibrio reynosensis]UOF00201.1 FAD-dependent oxidoreductase [Bdellovibrio reynosensis]